MMVIFYNLNIIYLYQRAQHQFDNFIGPWHLMGAEGLLELVSCWCLQFASARECYYVVDKKIQVNTQFIQIGGAKETLTAFRGH